MICSSVNLDLFIRPSLLLRARLYLFLDAFQGVTSPAHASTFKTLYHFADKSDGGNPLAGVTLDPASPTLYGETYYGGGVACLVSPYPKLGCGTVYSFAKGQGLKILATFSGPNGARGNVRPVLIGNTLYGATAEGGANGDGVVFSVNTDGSNFSILHQFSGTDGTDPDALVADSSGTLYGITQTGGTNNYGVLFSITPTGTYTVLYNFNLPLNAYPNALIAGPNATLVGSTRYGGSSLAGSDGCCGTMFDYSETTRKFSNLFTFPATGADGGYPYVGSIGPGPTLYAGQFYAINSLSTKSGLQILAPLNSYTYGSGVTSGPLYTPGGILYGVLLGSIDAPAGIIYRLQSGVITDLYVFSGDSGVRDGTTPMAEPVRTPSGVLIGTTTAGGNCAYCGTIWELTP